MKVVRMAMRGEKHEVIARTIGVTARTVSNILKRLKPWIERSIKP